MEEELGLVGASADDTEAELIRSICETELLDGKCDCHQGALAPSACVKAQVWWVTDPEGGRLLPSEGNAVIFLWCQFLRRLSVSLPLWRWFFNDEIESTSFYSLQEFWDKLSNCS